MILKFSVIIPIYNVAPYVQEALDSVRDQTLKDFEVIMVNDGSTDESAAIAERFSEVDSRFRLAHQNNMGASCARNAGLSMATGKYIYFLDADDLIQGDTLDIAYGALERHAADVVMFEGTIFGDNLKELGFHFCYRRPKLSGPQDSGTFLCESISQNALTVSPCCFAARRTLLANLRFIEGHMYEDNHFFFSMLSERQAKVVVLNLPLFKRRLRPESIMTIRKTLHHYESLRVQLRSIQLLSFRVIPTRFRSDIRRRIISGLLGDMLVTSAMVTRWIRPSIRARNALSVVQTAAAVGWEVLSVKRLLTAFLPELYWLRAGPPKSNRRLDC